MPAYATLIFHPNIR